MHELGIVFHVIRAVEDIGRQQQLTDVASVTLELGQVSGVVPHELESCWKWAVARTELMPRAQLRFETVHAITHCDGCGRDYVIWLCCRGTTFPRRRPRSGAG